MQVEFQVFRQLPPDPPHIQSFVLETTPGTTILDCLTRIKWEQDGSLAFRKNCRNTICGSCAMRINGRAALACKQHVEDEIQDHHRILIGPLGNFPVTKDLVVDMASFWQDLDRVKPYVEASLQLAAQANESLQPPEEREAMSQASNCILCGACYSDCNAKEWNPDFVGPHALAKANRLLQDSRDQTQRLEDYNSNAGVWGCTRCLNCNAVCPMEVAPLDQITQIKQTLLAQSDLTEAPSRAIRHRKTLVDLVKTGGWIDERRFGLTVVANWGRDLEGLASLVPLGIRMLRRGKFPFHFKPAEDTKTVRQLIDAVRDAEANDKDSSLR